jgi:outer membrane protein assembly factor BamB
MRSVKRGSLLLLATLLACQPPRRVPSVPAGEWTSYLGSPERSAYAAETVSADLAVAWRTGIGRGVSAPVQVHGDVVLAATTSRTIVVLNANSGMQYWSRTFRSALAGAPLKHGERVFVGTGDRDRKVHAIEITRGRGIWSRDVGTVRVEPILADSRVVVSTDEGNVIALAEDDGRILWSTPIRSSPAAPAVSWESSIFVVSTADSLYRLDAERGGILARVALPGTVSAPPLLADGLLILPMQSGRLAGFRLPTLDSIWSADLGTAIQAAPVVAGGAIFALSRDATVWRIGFDGAARRIVSLGGAVTAALTAVRDRLLVGRLDGTLVLLDLQGQELWRHDFGDSIVAPVAVQRGGLYVALLRGDLVKMQAR